MNAINLDGASDGVPSRYIEAFLDRLRFARYSEVTLDKKRWVLCAFSRWMKRMDVAVTYLDESAIASFVERLTSAPPARIQFERAVLRMLLAYLRSEAIVRLPTARGESDIAQLHRSYLDYLRQDRGLATNSVLVYAPFIRDFLESHESGGHILPDAFDANMIRNHLLARSKGRSGEYIRLMAVALRSFCRFLFLHGDTVRDLHDSVPTVRKYRQSSVPTFLTPEQAEALIATADRSTPTGRRDYAILLLLARLGLRAGEIVALELSDIRWSSAELVVHEKGANGRTYAAPVRCWGGVGPLPSRRPWREYDPAGLSAQMGTACWSGGTGGDRPYCSSGLRSCGISPSMPRCRAFVPSRSRDDDDTTRRVDGGNCRGIAAPLAGQYGDLREGRD